MQIFCNYHNKINQICEWHLPRLTVTVCCKIGLTPAAGTLVCTVGLGYISLLFGVLSLWLFHLNFIWFKNMEWIYSYHAPVNLEHSSCWFLWTEVAAESWALLYCFSIFVSDESPNLLPVFCVNESYYVMFIGIHSLQVTPCPVKVTGILMLLMYPFFAA